jgi:acyl phosphate:glycerol-3-phosphate acyltransferase
MILIVKGLLIIAAYLLGAIPSSVWIGKRFFGIDVREHGSKNAGSTNTIRILGWKAGLPVLLIDILKGWTAVSLVYLTSYYSSASADFINFQFYLGIAAVIGHIFPVYVGFKGGKGVATLLGIFLAIAPYPTLIAFGIFFVTLLLTRYVSLSSIIAGVSFPVLQIVIFKTSVQSLVIFSMLVTVLLLLTHQKNIERLIRKEESKANFLFKKNKGNHNKMKRAA